MLDRFIERWLGPLLLVLGGLGLVAAAALERGWFAAPPEPLPPGVDLRVYLGFRGALYEQPGFVGSVAFLCLVVGFHLTRHFRRERAAAHASGTRVAG
jgi:hypothetical protein